MLTYIQGQKLKLHETKQLLKSLKSEKEELEPIVKTRRETIEQILEAQTKRNRKIIWRDRLFGFISGVFASITGTIIFVLFLKKRDIPVQQSPNITT